jgi:protein-S-isoprenylcysteine O-methyltransferase Ste14
MPPPQGVARAHKVTHDTPPNAKGHMKTEMSHRSLPQRAARFLTRTPVQTFLICPLLVVAFELALGGGRLTIVPWGVPLLAWGYAQYLLVGRYRLGLAGGGPGLETPPERILARGPYRYVRNPMYLGHLIFMAGLALTFWSWFAVILLAVRAVWFHTRVLKDEARLSQCFGPDYVAYCGRVKRWLPGVL